MTDAPERIWIDGSPSPDNEWFVEPTVGYCEVEYIRADLVPQPPEPPHAEVEAAAALVWEMGEFAGLHWREAQKLAPGGQIGSEAAKARRIARAALIAARKARA